MTITRIGIIGLIILLPLQWISYFNIRADINSYKQARMFEEATLGSISDGLYAMKTFSKLYYDKDDLVKLEVPEDEIIDTIKRSYAYSLGAKSDIEVEDKSLSIAAIGFIQYDKIIIYDIRRAKRIGLPIVDLKLEDRGGAGKLARWEKTDLISNEEVHNKTVELMGHIISNILEKDRLILSFEDSSLYGKSPNEVGIIIVLRKQAYGSANKPIIKMASGKLIEKDQDFEP